MRTAGAVAPWPVAPRITVMDLARVTNVWKAEIARTMGIDMIMLFPIMTIALPSMEVGVIGSPGYSVSEWQM